MTTKNPPTRKKSSSGLVPALLALSFLLPTLLPAAEKSKQQPQAILAGTVYDENGFALAGVPIEVRRPGEKKPKWRAASDRRGEFAIRVPAGRATYVISTASKQHASQEQALEVYGNERAEVLFRLTLRPRR